jgi:hypothetical protein
MVNGGGGGVILFWILNFGFWIGEYLTRQEFWKLKSCKSKPKWY